MSAISVVHAATVTDDILSCEMKNLLKNPVCESPISAGELNQICKDPVEYACKNSPPRGIALTSKCKINFNDAKSTGETPEAIGLVKEIRTKEAEFLTSHVKECVLVTDCAKYLRTQYVNELHTIQAKVAYSPERWGKLQAVFREVKLSATRIIQSSKNLSEVNRAVLLERIDSTILRDPHSGTPEPCEVLYSDNPVSGAYNQAVGEADGIPKITICMGLLSSLDRMDESTLFITLGHELSHSIDPCSLDELASDDSNFPNGKIFKSTVDCLRGSKTCSSGVLHCNAGGSVKDYCSSQIKAKAFQTKAQCLTAAAKISHCPLSGDEDVDETTYDYSQFRAGPAAIDQTEESFADFVGAQIYADYLKHKETEDPEATSTHRRRDILIAMGTDYASLHGICRKENTNDEHPSGEIRVLNNIIGNRELGQILCPNFTGKQCGGI